MALPPVGPCPGVAPPPGRSPGPGAAAPRRTARHHLARPQRAPCVASTFQKWEFHEDFVGTVVGFYGVAIFRFGDLIGFLGNFMGFCGAFMVIRTNTKRRY